MAPLSGGDTKPGALQHNNDDTDQSVARVDETKPAQKARLKGRGKKTDSENGEVSGIGSVIGDGR